MKIVFGILLLGTILTMNEAIACGEKAAISYSGNYKLASRVAGKNLLCEFDGVRSKGFVRMKNEKCGGWITYVSIDALNDRFAVRKITRKEKSHKFLIETIDENSPPLVCEFRK